MQRIGTKITVTVPEDLLEEITQIAERFEMSKAQVARLLMETGLDTYKTFRLIGVVKLAEVARKNKLKRKKKEEEKSKK